MGTRCGVVARGNGGCREARASRKNLIMAMAEACHIHMATTTQIMIRSIAKGFRGRKDMTRELRWGLAQQREVAVSVSMLL